MSDPSGRFTLVLPGEVDISERTRERDSDYYDVVIRAGEARDHIELNVDLNYDEVEAVCSIGVHEVGILHKETGRQFNICVDVYLQRSDVQNLHAYLEFLLGLKS